MRHKFITYPYDVPAVQGLEPKQTALDPEFLQTNPEYRYLYHMTFPRVIPNILERGLIPHDNPEGYGKSRYENDRLRPRSNRVYLGTQDLVARYGAPMLRVDLNQLDPNNIGSDEDNHEHRASELDIEASPTYMDWDKDPRRTLGAWADKNSDVLDSPENTEYSLDQGSVTHYGKIPPHAIEINPEWNIDRTVAFFRNHLQQYESLPEGYPIDEEHYGTYKEMLEGIAHWLAQEFEQKTGKPWVGIPGYDDDANLDRLVGYYNWLRDRERLMARRSFTIESAWPDIMQKAKRYLDSGRVVLHRNGFNHILATVIGDHGTYQTEISRQDPESRAITGWSCSCPWGDYAWGRSRQWRKYEGRPCVHVLSALWKAFGTPLDEDMEEDEVPAPGETGPAVPVIEDMQQEQVEESPEHEELEPESTLEPPTVKDLTIPGQPLPPGPPQKDLMPPIEPEINQPMKFPPPKPKNPYQFPGALSRHYPHVARFVAGEDVPVTVKLAAVDITQLKNQILQGQTPIAKAATPITGEYSGGKIPVPGSTPMNIHDDGTPLYDWRDLGWNPEKNRQEWPPQNGPAETGRFGEIPTGASLEVWDVDLNTGWILVAYSTNFGPLQHHLIKAWVEPSEITLTGRTTPFVRKRT